MRTWACKFFRSLQKLETQEGKTTEEEERMESLERPTLRSKVWKSWNILSPETCDREEGGVGVSLMIRTRCNYRATPLTVIDQWGTPLMKTRTRWAPRSQTGKKWKVGIEIPEREGAERMGQILKKKKLKNGILGVCSHLYTIFLRTIDSSLIWFLAFSPPTESHHHWWQRTLLLSLPFTIYRQFERENKKVLQCSGKSFK